MKRTIAIAAAVLLIGEAVAQRPEKGVDYDEGYKAGFREGYSKGYREGLAEGERRGASFVPPPPPVAPPPKPGPTGPITISNAWYGTSSKNCNATGWLARRVNGRLTANVDVENKICGDPAPGQKKSLEVTYICGNFVKNASAYEHRTLYLDCTS